MKDLSILYTLFQECLLGQDVNLLDEFNDQDFWEILTREEKVSLASLFIQRAEKLFLSPQIIDAAEREDIMIESFFAAESLAPDADEIYYRQSAVFYQFASQHHKWRYFLYSLDKLTHLHSLNPHFFEKHLPSFVLWGNILLSLGRALSDSSFFAQASEKFEKAAALFESHSLYDQRAQQLYWDWGETWIHLGKSSGEIYDFLQGIEKYRHCEKLGCQIPHFRIDYGEALFELTKIDGNPHHLVLAIDQFKKAIVTSSNPEISAQGAHDKGWLLYALAAKKKAEITGNLDDYEEAHRIFHEALTQIPERGDLWLSWGEMYLRLGWIKKNTRYIETAVEKIASMKMPSCNPITVAALLGEGFITLGYLLEDLRMIKEGEERVLQGLRIAPKNRQLLYAKGLAQIALGLYFDETSYFSEAVEIFKQGIDLDSSYVEFWQGLYEASFHWGSKEENEFILQISVSAIEKVVQLSPFTPNYWFEWGLVLFRICEIVLDKNLTSLSEVVLKFQKAIDLCEGKADPEYLLYYAMSLDLLGEVMMDESYSESAIDILEELYDENPESMEICYHLALAYSHLGELLGDENSLFRAIHLWDCMLSKEPDDALVLCDVGYALLYLSELMNVKNADETQDFRQSAEVALKKGASLGNTEVFYHLACLYSLQNMYLESVDYLKKAEKANNLPEGDDLLRDDWLEGVRQTADFRNFLIGRNQD